MKQKNSKKKVDKNAKAAYCSYGVVFHYECGWFYPMVVCLCVEGGIHFCVYQNINLNFFSEINLISFILNENSDKFEKKRCYLFSFERFCYDFPLEWKAFFA